MLSSRLKFRVAQPMDIPRCYELENAAYPPDGAATKSTLQNLQHHAAPFFRCVLLKKPEGSMGTAEGACESNSIGAMHNENVGGDEACHHMVHQSKGGQLLIGYVCATRCHDFAEVDASSETSDQFQSTLYPTKHEPSGRFLAIHSIVVQKEYQRLGVARALLEYYIKSIEIYNSELDEAGINRRRNRIKAKDRKIERIILLTHSSMISLFVSAGFRWRATVKGGLDPLYEMERKVADSPSAISPESDLQPSAFWGQECFVVDAFVNPRAEYGSGNPAAVVRIRNPSELFSNNQRAGLNTESSFVLPEDGDSGEFALFEEEQVDRAEVWMQAVSRELNQSATAFVWPIDLRKKVRQDSLSMSGDEQSFHDDSSHGPSGGVDVANPPRRAGGVDYCIRFFTRSGIEADWCAHATLAAASVLFSQYVKENTKTITFHSRNGVVVSSPVSPPAPDDSCQTTSSPTKSAHDSVATVPSNNITRIAMECQWRTVEALPPGPECQGAVLAMLRRSFFRAFSAVAHDERDEDTDEMAFSLSFAHVNFIGVTSGGSDLFIELTAEGYEMIRGRNVDYDELNQGWTGFSKGVIICCEPPDETACQNEEFVANCQEDAAIDFFWRYFPKFASEDPSGSSPCALGPYFGSKRGKQRLVGLQSSERGSLVECILKESEQTMVLVGSGMTTIQGKTLLRA